MINRQDALFFLKKHWIAFVFALIAGLIYVAPNLIFTHSSYYKGLPMMYTDAESLYLTRINAAYTGCILNCNPFIKEYKNSFPFFDSSLSEPILAFPGIIFHIPILTLKIFYEFLLPFILFLLVYSLAFRLIKNRGLSIFTATLIVLGYNLFNISDLLNFHDFIELLRLRFFHPDFLIFSRPVNPQFSSLIFFVYLNVLLSVVIKKTWKYVLLLALVYGFSFYIYFFTYTFMTVVQGVWVCIYLLRKDWEMLSRFCIGTLCGLLIATPQFINIYKLFHHPYYSTMMINMVKYTHIPHVSLQGILLFLLFVMITVVYVKRIKDIPPSAYFLAALIFSCFILRNEHVLIGIDMQYFHFERYMFDPIFIIFCCFCFNEFFGEISKKYHYIFLFMSIIPIANASFIQYRAYQQSLPNAQFIQKYIPVLQWLKEKVPEGSIISSTSSIVDLIPLYTHNYILWNSSAEEWMSVPGRIEEITSARSSAQTLEQVGQKYGVDYYIEDKKLDIFSHTGKDNKKFYEDDIFVVYKAHD